MEEIMKKYRGYWVAVKVEERDSVGQPVKGEVVSYHGIRSMVIDTVYSEPDVCIFKATTVPEEGYVAMF